MRITYRLRTTSHAADRARDGARMLCAGATGAALAYLLDPQGGRRRRHVLRDRTLAVGRRGVRRTTRQLRYAGSTAVGAGKGAMAGLAPHRRDYDDVTLARKVETEIFRPADAPKGSVNVNVHEGVVELRGQVERPEQIDQLGMAASRVEGVQRVDNLLHTPGSPPRHAPSSDPAEVRRRAGLAGPPA
jgi:BON domain